MAKTARRVRPRFVCGACGADFARWFGYCPSCGDRTPLVEDDRPPAPDGSEGRGGWRAFAAASGDGRSGPVAWDEVDTAETPRIPSGLPELDRVLGGGVVAGSAVLVAGEPGAGKSTLLLQLAASAAGGGGAPVLYVSGEESERQIRMRGDRLGLAPAALQLLCETDTGRILAALRDVRPRLVILDSVQCVFSPDVTGAPGTVTQVREAATAFVLYAKATGTPVFLIGHVNKDGAIAGPRTLEHIVDAVVHFEGDRRQSYRLLRAIKNRFGAAGELGVFEMTGRGLVAVENPSRLFLSGAGAPPCGAAVVCTLEGTRALLAEVQALLAESPFAQPRRVTVGFDSGRLAVLMAVLETTLGGRIAKQDVYIAVTGGLEVSEPAADLGLLAAVVSRHRGAACPPSTVYLGEVGLSGEVRPVHQAAARLREAARLGFRRAVLNPTDLRRAETPKGFEISAVASLDQVTGSIG